MLIQVTSAGFDGDNEATIRINNELVMVQPNESNHFRGLHIVVINSWNCKVEFTNVFDTYKSSEGFE